MQARVTQINYIRGREGEEKRDIIGEAGKLK